MECNLEHILGALAAFIAAIATTFGWVKKHERNLDACKIELEDHKAQVDQVIQEIKKIIEKKGD